MVKKARAKPRLRARRGLASARRKARRATQAVLARWRRSLHLRVVATTMVVSMCVVALLGFFLMQQIQGGLLHAKLESAQQEAKAGWRVAQERLESNGANVPEDRGASLDKLVRRLGTRSGPSGRYDVIIMPGSAQSSQSYVVARTTNGISMKSVPDELQREVGAGGTSKQHSKWAELHYRDKGAKPGLVVGEPVGSYELYYLFPLTQEVQTLTIVRNTLATAGIALVLLLAAIAYLVARQVVTPVRGAAMTAKRLAAGDLQERMRVRGEDDLARLATSFNEMADNLQEQIGQLEELSRVQRRFVADVSHELRTPLSTIRVAADVVHEAKESFDPMVSRSAELLQTQLDRFEALLTDLLEISRYDAGAAVLDPESLDMRDLVLHAVGDTEALAERRATRVVQRLPGGPCLTEVDRRRVERVLRNLLVNAIEHGEGRDVVVTAAADRDAVAVTVRDHGCGFDGSASGAVFDRFWRADPARARTTGGTGLGLSISREDATLHGGWLQAWGEPGNGAQFRLSLPRRTGEELRGSPLPLVPVDLQDSPTNPNGIPALPASDDSATTVNTHG